MITPTRAVMSIRIMAASEESVPAILSLGDGAASKVDEKSTQSPSPWGITEAVRILQFGDSVLPVGAFSFSNGLESAIQHGIVCDRDTLRQFVATATHQAASCDGIAMLTAYRAASAHDLLGIIQADHALFNRKLNEEMRTMTVRMGKKLGEVANHLIHTRMMAEWLGQIERKETPGTYPIGLGIVFAGLSLPETAAFAVHQYGTASMILSASLRLMKIHYFDAQAILLDVNSLAEAEYARVCEATLDEMATFSPSLDILAAAHVRAHIRMFMN